MRQHRKSLSRRGSNKRKPTGRGVGANVSGILKRARSVPRYTVSRERDALIDAIEQGKTAIALALLRHGVDPDGKDGKGKSALWHAAYWCRTEVIRELVERGATLPDDVLMGPVHEGELDTVRLLIKHGANVNCVARYTRYAFKFPGPAKCVLTVALERLAWKVPEEVAIALIEGGATVNRLAYERPVVGDYNRTLLGVAAQKGAVAVVKAMIRAGADVNRLDTWGGTALLDAVSEGHVRVVKVLLAGGAKDIARRDGLTALAAARRQGLTELAEGLERAGR